MSGLNARQQKFCHYFVLYGNAAAAAREARYAPAFSRQHGFRLLRMERIRARIIEIYERMARENCRNLDQLFGKLECIYLRSMSDHQFYSAARAVELQAKLAKRMGALAEMSINDQERP